MYSQRRRSAQQSKKPQRQVAGGQKIISPFQFLVCLLSLGWVLFAMIEQKNRLIELQMIIPKMTKELKNLQEENRRLKYEVERFESPLYLMELARRPEYAHLKFPYQADVVIIP